MPKYSNALFIVEVHLAIKLVYRHSTFDNLKETIEINLTGQESQLGRRQNSRLYTSARKGYVALATYGRVALILRTNRVIECDVKC